MYDGRARVHLGPLGAARLYGGSEQAHLLDATRRWRRVVQVTSEDDGSRFVSLAGKSNLALYTPGL